MTKWHKVPNKKEALLQVPLAIGVYRYWAKKEIIYVGKSIVLKARLASHTQNAKLDLKEKSIVERATHIDYTIVDNEFKALLLEAKEIKLHLPVYNRILKDDKSALYIVIDQNDSFPKPRLLRATDIGPKPSKRTRIFGPFPTTKIAESVLTTIRRLIPFCIQKNIGQRRCFYAHLGLCHPCPSIIKTKEEKLLYRLNISKVIKILEGKIDPVIDDFQKQIKFASQKKDYELALKLRNKVQSFESYIKTHSFSDKRVLSYNSADSALESLRLHLSLGDGSLGRIECYDASHSAFQNGTVAMVVATDGLIDKGQYKHFRLKRKSKSDFDQLEEALERRFKNDWPTPDLIVIDGGVPQLRKLQKVLDQMPKPPRMIGLAKHPDRLIIPHFDYSNNQRIEYTKIELPLSDPGLNLLQQLRDEAHRFGNKYRLKLQKTTFKS